MKEHIVFARENFNLFAARIKEIEQELTILLTDENTDNPAKLKGEKATIFQEGRKEILFILSGIRPLGYRGIAGQERMQYENGPFTPKVKPA